MMKVQPIKNDNNYNLHQSGPLMFRTKAVHIACKKKNLLYGRERVVMLITMVQKMNHAKEMQRLRFRQQHRQLVRRGM